MAFNAGDIEAKLTLDRDAFHQGLDAAKDEVRDFEDEDHRLEIEVGADLDDARLDLDDFRDEQELRDVKLNVKVDKDGAGQDIDDALGSVGRSAASAGETGGAGLMPILIGLAAIPGGAAIAGVALTAVPLAFALASAKLLKDNQQVATSFSAEWEGVRAQLVADAGPMAGVFVQIAQESNLAFHDMGDQIMLTFRGAAQSTLLFSHGVEDLITNLIPGLQSAVGAGLPTIQGMDDLLAQTGAGLTAFFVNVSQGSVQSGQGLTVLGTIVNATLGSLGTLVTQLSGGWASIGPTFAAQFNQLLDTVTRFTGTAVPAFAGSFHTVEDAAAPLLSLLNTLAPLLGAIGGNMGVWVTAARLLDGPLGSIGSKLSSMASKMEDSSGGSSKLSSGLGKLGSVVSSTANKLPLIGAAVSGVQGGWEAAFGTQDQFTQGLENGGKAAEDARSKLAGNDEMVNQIRDSLGGWAGDLASNFIPTSKSVNQAYQDWFDSLDQVGQAQAGATQAQNQYNNVVATYGRNSPQAVAALGDYQTALGQVEQAQHAENDELQTSIQKEEQQVTALLGLVGATLGYQGSLLNLKSAQNGVTTAIQAHGAKSLEAQQAENSYQVAILGVIKAAGDQAVAMHATGTASDQAKSRMDAQTGTILGLAAAAGSHAPPALRQLVAGLTDAEISAFRATGKVDGTRQAIVKVKGKDVKINVNGSGQAVANAHAVTNAIAGVKSKDVYLNTYINTIVKGPATQPKSLSGLLGIQPHASGGESLPGVELTGEDGPELRFRDRSSFIATANQTRDMVRNALSGSQGGSGLTAEQMMAAVAAGVARALNGSRMRVDGDGLARLVNNTNLVNSRR
jgi:hypothetical protein